MVNWAPPAPPVQAGTDGTGDVRNSEQGGSCTDRPILEGEAREEASTEEM